METLDINNCIATALITHSNTLLLNEYVTFCFSASEEKCKCTDVYGIKYKGVPIGASCKGWFNTDVPMCFLSGYLSAKTCEGAMKSSFYGDVYYTTQCKSKVICVKFSLKSCNSMSHQQRMFCFNKYCS